MLLHTSVLNLSSIRLNVVCHTHAHGFTPQLLLGARAPSPACASQRRADLFALRAHCGRGRPRSQWNEARNLWNWTQP